MDFAILLIWLAVFATLAGVFLAVGMAKLKILRFEGAASSLALKTMEDAMIILDSEWRFLSCNESAKRLFSSLASFPRTQPIRNADGWPRELDAADEAAEIIFNSETGAEGGPISTYRAKTNRIVTPGGKQLGWSIVIRDTTEINSLIGQLQNLATTDSLTGIDNRRSFLEKVEREIEMASPSRLNTSNALIMYDIDDFKKVNDEYGHAAGDHVLCEVVETIKKQLRSYDIIARYGGEEFVIFMPSSKEDSLCKIAKRLCGVIEKHEIYYGGTRIPITASFGAVQMPPGSNFSEAMLAVDEAMYEAKNSGKNQVAIGAIKKNGGSAEQAR